MYDFQGVLIQANEAFENKDYAQAAYYYWEINFAYEDEEFPYSYTVQIGSEASSGFQRAMERITVDEILNSGFFKTYQKWLGNSKSMQKYLLNFERDISQYAMRHSNKVNMKKDTKMYVKLRFMVVLLYVICLIAMIYNDATTSLEDGWLERVPFSLHNMYPASWVIPAFAISFFLLPLYWRVGAKDHCWGICLFPVRQKGFMTRALGVLITLLWTITALPMTLSVFDSIKDPSINDIGLVDILFIFTGLFWIIIGTIYFGIYWLKKHSMK
ncbi:MAG: hypothetical protein NC453_24160 [Muribaculum sp.]|nr:hypothetical protein [Muribaculum sp.]